MYYTYKSYNKIMYWLMDWVQLHFKREFWEEIIVLSVFVLSAIIAGIVRWIKRH